MNDNIVNVVPLCSDLDNLTRSETYPAYQRFSFWTNGVVLGVLVAIGLAGNACIMQILALRHMRARISPYLIVLAVWDCVVLASSFLLFSWNVLVYGGAPLFGTPVYLYAIFYPISNVGRTASVWVLLITTVERFVAVCFPLSSLLGVQSRFILTAASVGAVLFNIPRCFEVIIARCLLADGHSTVPVVLPTDLRLTREYYLLYHVVLGHLFVSTVPFVVQSALTLQIFRQLKRRFQLANLDGSVHCKSKHRGIIRERDAEDSMTAMLTVVAAKFVLCLLLPTIADLYEIFQSSVTETFSEEYAYIVDISSLLVVVNSAVNFFVYFLFCRRFRKATKRFFSTSRRKSTTRQWTRSSFAPSISNCRGNCTALLTSPDTHSLINQDALCSSTVTYHSRSHCPSPVSQEKMPVMVVCTANKIGQTLER